MNASARRTAPDLRRCRGSGRLPRCAGLLVAFLVLTAGCANSLWVEHSVVYAVQVVGLYEKYTVHYLAEDETDYREETPEEPIWQNRLTGQFNAFVDLEIQVLVEKVQPPDFPSSGPVYVPPPKVSCGILVDEEVRASETSSGVVSCRVNLDTPPPYSLPAGLLSLLPFLFPLGAIAVVAAVTIRAYRRRSRPTSASTDVDPPGYERRPHLKHMVRCGQVGLAILAVGLFLSFWLDTPLTVPRPPESPPVRLPLPDWPQNRLSVPGDR